MAGFCDNGQSQQNQTKYIDPLGPGAGAGGSGAPELRSQLFNYLGGSAPALQKSGQAYAQALQSTAANPIWGEAENNATANAQGRYLNGSPQLDRAMATQAGQTMAHAAGDNARIRSQYQKNGMAFSTGNQQAQEGETAAAGASAANTNAQTYLQNYLAERGNQNNAAGQYASSAAAPLSYLSGVSGALTQPLSQAGNLLSSLSSGGQVITTGSSGVSTPGLGQSIQSGIGSL